jgi:hypothetical protein
MAVPVVNISIEQNADFASTFTLTNADGTLYDLTNSTATSRLKKFPSSITSYSFATSIIVAKGKITISMGDRVTSTISPGRYYYDILVTSSSGIKTRVIEGMALVTAGIST